MNGFSISSPRVKAVFVSAGFLLLFFLSSTVVYMLGVNTLAATAVADIIISMAGILYIRKAKLEPVCMSNKSIGIQNYLLIIGLFAFVWLFSQITSSWILMNFDSSSYDAYSHTASSDIFLYRILTVFFAPIGEEIMMRGVIFKVFQKGFPEIGRAHV